MESHIDLRLPREGEVRDLKKFIEDTGTHEQELPERERNNEPEKKEAPDSVGGENYAARDAGEGRNAGEGRTERAGRLACGA